jgi:hypothetical protein
VRETDRARRVAFREGTLRHLRCTNDGARHGRLADIPSATRNALPPCAACDQPVTVDQDVVFLRSGHVEHVHCPSPVCSACTKPILSDDAARRFRNDAFHERCWVRRPRTIGGGASEGPWTLIFDRRLAIRAATDHAADQELLAVSREVWSHSRAVVGWARAIRMCR